MWTRLDVQRHYTGLVTNLRVRIRNELTIVRRGQLGRHYFWRADVLRIFGGPMAPSVV